MEPIRAIEINKPMSVTPIHVVAQNKTVYVYEFAQNAAGTGILSLSNCPAGTTVSLFYSEVLCGYGPTRWSGPCTKGGFGCAPRYT